MSLTESKKIKFATHAPKFNLIDTVSNKVLSLEDIRGKKGTVVMFICNHCPYVVHVNPELVKIANDYISKGIGFVGISSNDVVNYPQDGPEKMKKHAAKSQYPFPYLYDETQEVAKAYDAVCTPDIYVFDTELKAYYHGQLDDSRPGNGIPLSGKDIREVLDNLVEGKDYTKPQTPSIGCNIKWK